VNFDRPYLRSGLALAGTNAGAYDRFLSRFAERTAHVDALCKAQLMMKNKYPDLYYWGSFICQGDPGSLTWNPGANPAESNPDFREKPKEKIL
jgi:hypothetical protein